MKQPRQYFLVMTTNTIVRLLIIACLILISMASWVQARQCFYFLVDETVECYSMDGVFQESFPLTSYPESGQGYRSFTTDGYAAWTSHQAEYDYVTAEAFRPGGSGALFPINATESGFCGGIAINGATTYLGRYKHYLDPNPFRIELYSSGSFADQWDFSPTFYPDHMQYISGWIVVASGATNTVRIYDTSGDLEREFSVDLYPGHDITALSADSSYIYLQYYNVGTNKAHAFDGYGNRQAAHDVDFPGLAMPTGAGIAWGPDIPIIMPNPDNIDFAPLASGGQRDEPLTITNVGVENLQITAVTLGDTDNFTYSGISLPLPLLPGESQQLTISFTPQVTGDLATTLTMSSNCGANPELAIPLSGRSLAAIFYVDASATGTGDGSSWNNAFPSINAALVNANVLDGASLWVREGTYTLAGTIQVNKAVEIYGGFPGGVYNPDWSDRDWQNAPSVIQGNNGFTCVEISADGTIDGFTITDGYGSYTGGGIYVSATSDGPEVHAAIANCTVTGNTDTAYGGGIYVFPYVDSCSISDCLICNNNSSFEGGGMYLRGAGTVVTNCYIAENIAGRYGGGIYTDGNLGTAPVIERCVISGNEAQNGGGIYNRSRNTTITNCLISDNVTSDSWGGSGIESYNCSTPITNCTIANNHGPGGGFVASYAATPVPVLKNCILWGNQESQISLLSGAVFTVTYSDVDQDGYGAGGTTPDGSGNIRYNPLFVDAAGGDYHLRLGSVCIDAGTAAGAPLDDLYGIERPQLYGYDMGACEYDGIVYNGPWYVDGEMVSSGDGTSWVAAFKTIAEALEVAAAGEDVWVKNGTYLLDEALEIDKAVIIYGSFTGIGGERSSWQDGSTIIDGQELGNCYHIIADGTIDGFLITGGRDVATYGGAIYNETASPAISHCIFRNNTADNGFGMGGAIYSGNYSNDPDLNGTIPQAEISECIFEANYGQSRGGAFTGQHDASSFTNCLFIGNHGGLSSGVIWIESCTTTFTNCTFSNNRNGSAIYMLNYSAEIKNSIFWENGNELFNASGSSPLVTYSDIQGSYAGTGNIDLDPGFAAPGHWDDNGTPADAADDFWISGNYHLAFNSDCIDTGSSTGAPVVDLDGISRPQDVEVDMGAYEYIALPSIPSVDFNGDGSHDIALFNPDNSKWYIRNQLAPTYGTTDCLPVPGDYDGDGATDLAAVDLTRPDGLAKWYLDGAGIFIYGLQEWIPVPGDYNGDGVTDAALFNPDTGKWYVRNQFVTTYGAGGIPVPGDYDGDGITDIAVFYPATNKWYIKDVGSYAYGMADCIPVPADYDGDGVTDLAVIDTSRPDGMAKWYIRNQAVFIYGAVANTIPVPSDYDGDGDADPCLFYQDYGKWYCRNVGIWSYGNGDMIPLAANLATRYAISQAAGGNAVW